MLFNSFKYATINVYNMLHEVSEYRTLYSITNFVKSIYLNISIVKRLEVIILH